MENFSALKINIKLQNSRKTQKFFFFVGSKDGACSRPSFECPSGRKNIFYAEAGLNFAPSTQ